VRRVEDTCGPPLRADSLELAVTHEVFVGLAVAERMVPELEIRNQPAVGEKCRAHAGAQGHHHFHTRPMNDAEPLQVGVVQHAYRPFEQLGQSVPHGYAPPKLVAEIGSVLGYAVLDHPRKADGNALLRRQGAGHVANQR